MKGFAERKCHALSRALQAVVNVLSCRTTHKAALALALLVLGIAQAATLGVPSPFSTIQAAINAAASGDTVLVSAGTYYENINFSGKAITVTSSSGPASTIIDGNGAGSVVTFSTGEGPSSKLSGFTLRNGRASFNGGGVLIQNTSPTITGNTITGNQACSGVGISVYFGSPLIQNNTISNNSQAGCSGGTGGGGVYIGGSGTAQLIGNLIANNTLTSANGGGVSLNAAGSPTIQGNVIRNNSVSGISPCAQGGGIALANASNALIIENLITGNSAGCGGGLAWLVPSGSTGPLLVNNTIADNTSPSGSGIYADGFDSQTKLINNLIIGAVGQSALYCGNFAGSITPILQNNDVFTPQGGTAYSGVCTNATGSNGNISSDPAFVASTSADYHLQAGSPAIDKGLNSAPSLPATDLDGHPRVVDGNGDGLAIVDMGAYEYQPVVTTITVQIDIKPGTTPNVINLSKKGTVPVAILSTASFNAPNLVVATSLKFGRTGNESSLASCGPPQDVNGDGLPDLVCQFNVQQTGFQPRNTQGVLTGLTTNGTPITGSDSVVIK